MKKSKKNIIFSLFSAILFVFIVYLALGGVVKKKSLDANLEYTKAIVLDHFYTIRYSNFLSYEFFVNGELYQGSGKSYPKNDTLSVGDTIVIVYDKTNPDNNKPYRDYKVNWR